MVLPEVTRLGLAWSLDACAARCGPEVEPELDDADPPQPATTPAARSVDTARNAELSMRFLNVNMATSGRWGEQHVHPVVAGVEGVGRERAGRAVHVDAIGGG